MAIIADTPDDVVQLFWHSVLQSMPIKFTAHLTAKRRVRLALLCSPTNTTISGEASTLSLMSATMLSTKVPCAELTCTNSWTPNSY